jgi:eukaryotic-like serine/threonine-protein kinase
MAVRGSDDDGDAEPGQTVVERPVRPSAPPPAALDNALTQDAGPRAFDGEHAEDHDFGADPEIDEHDLDGLALGSPMAPAGVSEPPRDTAASLPRPPESSTTVGSPLDALARDEVMRTRRFVVVGMVIAAAGLLAAPLLPGDPIATRILFVSISIALVGLSYLWWRTRNAVRLDGWAVALAWYIPALCVTTAIPYFGAFSPAPIVLVLGIYFTGLGSSRILATAIYVTCAAVQAGTAGLVIAGVTHDTGVVQIAPLSTRNAIVVQLLVQLVLAATFLVARLSRRTTLMALTELEAAVRAVAQREALLEEARDELERALRSGRGRGRFSEQTIGGFKIGGVIGRGAMGEVYEATSAAGDPVAVKLLSQTSLGNANHVRRFLRELGTAASITSPHVVRVLAVGDRPVPYLVMERLDGKDLGETLRGRRHLAPAQVVDLVRQVGAGITAAGAAGVVHRDLKPQNLVLHRGTWKVLDFGVSRFAGHGGTLTAGHVVGTPAYMAPEQARGAAIDHRTDLYALAAIAYRALTGQPPFAGREVAATIYRVVHGTPPRPSTLVAVPADVDLALAVGLAKDPARRFATAAELADALEAALAGALPEPIRARARAIDRPWAD